MAITKTYLGGDLAELQSFLAGIGIFKSVTVSDNLLTCTDDNDITVLTISKDATYTWTFTVFLSGEHTYEKQYSSHGLNYGYKCTHGAMLVLNYNSQQNQYSVLITKNQQGEPVFVIPDAYSTRNKVCCLSYYDMYPVSTYTLSPSTAGQTVLSPFITNADAGNVSYTPDAFYMPFGEYVGRGYAKFVMNGKMYLTDGYWVLLDGGDEP